MVLANSLPASVTVATLVVVSPEADDAVATWVLARSAVAPSESALCSSSKAASLRTLIEFAISALKVSRSLPVTSARLLVATKSSWRWPPIRSSSAAASSARCRACAAVANACRQNCEIVEVHFDLPRMPAECEHQQRGLTDESNGNAEGYRRDRPPSVSQRNGDEREKSAGNRIGRDVPPQHGADRGQHRHVHDA